ncbi:MAG: sulfatase [Chloroflexi bacterium]|nr:sulfatase [Chloroflexota bacterium]MYC55657.1 sulfatase [Chloroflexota bacterium]MYE77986.1 sulfatase [Chloroflexota bacterium]
MPMAVGSRSSSAGCPLNMLKLPATSCACPSLASNRKARNMTKPNVVFLLTDQWRLQALGYAGNTQVQTPNIDRLADESINYPNAISGYSVCCPWRASFLTGQYPLTHGVVVNDVPISSDPVGLGDAFKQADYSTAYIGKWHVDGRGRSSYIPPERRLGFDYFKALECSHDYNRSAYYAGDDDRKRYWDGYDVFAQTADAQAFIKSQSRERQPFLLVLSWGPPHNPYQTAPEQFREMYAAAAVELRPNVPAEIAARARRWLAGYYAHCSAIDQSVGDIVRTLEKCGLADDTVLVFASDHGDMLGSQGLERKQKPYEESIRVPFLLRYPAKYGRQPRAASAFLNAHDIMPTLLGVCDLPIPATVEGSDYSPPLSGEPKQSDCALLACFHPFGEWTRALGGREYRGIRTARYTYCRTLEAAWLLFDNEKDPFQLSNLVDQPQFAELQAELEKLLQRELAALGDEFLAGPTIINRWAYSLDETGTVPFRD